jgi:hypothetical protein
LSGGHQRERALFVGISNGGYGMDSYDVELRALVGKLAAKVERLEKLLLTFRQANLIMVAGVEENLGMERSKQPKHKPTAHRQIK